MWYDNPMRKTRANEPSISITLQGAIMEDLLAIERALMDMHIKPVRAAIVRSAIRYLARTNKNALRAAVLADVAYDEPTAVQPTPEVEFSDPWGDT